MAHKYRFILNGLLVYLTTVLIMIFLSMKIFTDPAPFYGIECSQFSYFFLGASSIILGIIYFVSEKKHNQTLSLNKIVLFCLTILFITGFTTILTTPEVTTFVYGEKTSQAFVSMSDKWIYILQLFVTLFGTYLVIHFVTHKKTSQRSYHWLFYALIFFVCVALIYSLIVERDRYIAMFTKDSKDNIPYIESFLGNRNSYGFILMAGIFSLAIVREFKKHWWQLALMAIFYCALLFTGSLTSIFSATIFTVFYYLFKTIKKMHFSMVKGILKIIVPVVVILVSTVVCVYGRKMGIKFFEKLDVFLFDFVFSKDFSTLTFRTKIWSVLHIFMTENPLYFIFGRGPGVSYRLFNYLEMIVQNIKLEECSPHMHNGIFDIFINYGLVGVGIYFAGIIYFIRSFAHFVKRDKTDYALLSFIASIIFTIYSLTESTYAFQFTWRGLIFGVLFVAPILKFYLDRKNVQQIECEEQIVQEHKIHNQSPIANPLKPLIIVGVVALVVAISSFFFQNIYQDEKTLISVVMLVIISLCIVFIMPIVGHAIAMNGKHILRKTIILLALYFILPGTLYALFLANIVSTAFLLIGSIVFSFSLLFIFTGVCLSGGDKQFKLKDCYKVYSFFNIKYILFLFFLFAINMTFFALCGLGYIAMPGFTPLLLILLMEMVVGLSLMLIYTKGTVSEDLAYYNVQLLRFEIYECKLRELKDVQ